MTDLSALLLAANYIIPVAVGVAALVALAAVALFVALAVRRKKKPAQPEQRLKLRLNSGLNRNPYKPNRKLFNRLKKKPQRTIPRMLTTAPPNRRKSPRRSMRRRHKGRLRVSTARSDT